MRSKFAFTVLICLAGASNPALAADDHSDKAWRQFQHVLGEPAPLAINRDHALGTAVTRPLPPLALEDITINKFLLGMDLFHERRLSSDGTQGCITCHAGPVSGTDGRPVSFGVNRARGKVNALTTFNAHLNFRQFWDGRSVTLADQVLEPIISELEMANTLEGALQSLVSDPGYVRDFQDVYADGVTINNMADAMAHFMRIQFYVSNSPFQQHLNGEGNVLSDSAMRGWQQFQALGCGSCHNGVNLGGNSYQRLGAVRSFYPEVREPTENDAGLAARSLREDDLYVVKVPNLHNIAMGLPYLHDGSVRTLEETVSLMARYQLDRELDEQDVHDIVEFLKSLTGTPFGVEHYNLINQLARAPHNSEHTEPSADMHDQAYRQSLQNIGHSFAELLVQMQHVDNGQVQHFDFVQFQHLELIRHSRAVQHPPAQWSAEQQHCALEAAQPLLAQVMELEWDIAGFLQQQAVKGIWQAHIKTPAPSSAPKEELELRIAEHQALAAATLSQINSVALQHKVEAVIACIK